VRRVWECPDCKRRQKTGGHVVNQLCNCRDQSDQAGQTWMRLMEEEKGRSGSAPETPTEQRGLD